LRIKCRGFFQIGNLKNHVAQLADVKIHSSGRSHTLQFFNID
jgi:hypothetical protein